MTDLERFYAHLEECDQCYGEGRDYILCDESRELIYEAANELPEHWQKQLERILRKEELQREADRNAAFYAGSEEF